MRSSLLNVSCRENGRGGYASHHCCDFVLSMQVRRNETVVLEAESCLLQTIEDAAAMNTSRCTVTAALASPTVALQAVKVCYAYVTHECNAPAVHIRLFCAAHLGQRCASSSE